MMNKEKRRGREINQETKGARLLMISCFSQKVENVIGREVCVCEVLIFCLLFSHIVLVALSLKVIHRQPKSSNKKKAD